MSRGTWHMSSVHDHTPETNKNPASGIIINGKDLTVLPLDTGKRAWSPHFPLLLTIKAASYLA